MPKISQPILPTSVRSIKNIEPVDASNTSSTAGNRPSALDERAKQPPPKRRSPQTTQEPDPVTARSYTFSKEVLSAHLSSLTQKMESDTFRFLTGHDAMLSPLPPELKAYREGWVIRDQEAVKRHADLVAGHDRPNLGTKEIADWVYRVIAHAATTPVTALLGSEYRLDSKGIEAIQAALEKITSITGHLKFFRDLREQTDFFRLLSSQGLIDDLNEWVGYISACSLQTLAFLKREGQVLIPTDFFCLPERDVIFNNTQKPYLTIGHATTTIISSLGEVEAQSNLCEVDHFETNGANSVHIDPNRFDGLRMNKLLLVPDRGAKFDMSEIPQEHHLEAFTVTSARRPKAFIKTTSLVYLGALDSDTEACIRGLQTSKETISKALFLEAYTPPQNFRRTLLNQRKLLENKEEMPAGGKARQRLHAVQRGGSCEFKSLTSAVCFLLNDEVAFQVFHLLLNKSALSDYKEMTRQRSAKRNNDVVVNLILEQNEKTIQKIREAILIRKGIEVVVSSR